MNTLSKTALIVAALAVLAFVWISKGSRSSPKAGCGCGASMYAANPLSENLPAASPAPTVAAPMPRLLDLGASRCVPCKMMAPILDDLKKEYTGRMQVDFIDVWQNPDAGKKYDIKMIPTQIFFDATGKELFRHEGFISKDDILAKWKELGVNIGTKTSPETRPETPKALH